MRRRTLLGLTGSLSIVSGGILTLVSCFADPREDDTVHVVDSCNVSALTATPGPEAAVKAFVEASDALLAKAKAANDALRDVCNAIDTDLRLPTGADTAAACFPISSRIAALLKGEPPAPPGALAVTHWVELY